VSKNITIAALALLVVFLADRLVRVENQRYALQSGLCKVDHVNLAPFWKCLETAQTRTSWFWHLYHASVESVPRVPL
jgi:hypothetical protein